MPLMGLLVHWTQMRKEFLSQSIANRILENQKAKRTKTEKIKNIQTNKKQNRIFKDCGTTKNGVTQV